MTSKREDVRILIIEPDVIIAHSLGQLLLKHGYSVDIAHSSSEAFELALSLKPNLLIVEPHLNGSTIRGVDAVNTILSLSPTTEVIS